MAITVSQLLVEVDANTRPAEEKLGGMNETIDRSGGFFSNALGGLLDFGKGAAIVATVGIGAITTGLGFLVAKGQEAEASQSRLYSAIDATGKTTGVTKDQVDALTNALIRKIPVDDQAIQASESIIARYSSIGKEVFPDVEERALDLSQAFGISLTTATKTLAKAMDDPVKGLTLLKKYGVDFTDQQKEQIKAMVAAGDTMGAQKIELDALKEKYGGAAEAAGNTFAGKLSILHTQLDNVFQTIGQDILPVLSDLLSDVMPVIQAMGDDLPGALKIAEGFINNQVKPALQSLAPALDDLKQSFTLIGHIVLDQMLPPLGQLIGPAASGLKGIAGFIVPLVQDFDQLAIFVAGMGATLEKDFLPPLTKLGSILSSAILPLFSSFQQAFAAIDFSGDSGDLDGLYAGLKDVADIFGTFVDIIGSDVIPEVQTLFTWFSQNILPAIEDVAGAVMSQIEPALHNLSDAFKQAQPFIKQIFSALNSLLPIVELVAAFFITRLAIGIGFVIGIVRGLIGAISGIIQAFTGVVQIVGGLFTLLQGIFTLNGDKISKGWDMLWSGVKNLIVGAIRAVLGFIGGFLSGVFGYFDNLTHGGLTKIGNFIGGIIQFFVDLPGNLAGAFLNLINAVGDTFNKLIDGAGDFIGAFIQRMLDGITGAVSSFGNALHSLVSTAVHNIPVVGALIPSFALGGIAPGGTALVGEDGPELVDLPAGSRVHNNAATRAALGSYGRSPAGGGTGQQHIVIELDGYTIGEAVVENMPQIVRLGTGVKR